MAVLVPAIHVLSLSRSKDVDARHKAGHDGGKLTHRRKPGPYSFFGTTRNVALARAITTPSALMRLCAKQIVLPVLITSDSTASHCPTCAVPMKSTASPIVTSDEVPPMTWAQL